MKQNAMDKAAVCFVVGLITIVPLTSQWFVLVPWLSFNPSRTTERLSWLLPYNIAVLSIWTNYYLAVTTKATKVPRDFNGSKRFCRKCNTFKPPRAHHCRECRSCVLKMDHHCPWLNNCVGFHNHHHFLRFLVSVSFASLYCLALFALYLRHVIRSQNPYKFTHSSDYERFYAPPPNNLALVVMIINTIIYIILLLSVGLLVLWQTFYASKNTTTIESLENDKIEKLTRRGIIDPRHARYPYDLGSAVANMRQVLGERVFLWWVPGVAPAGDGMVFPVHGDVVDPDVMWPPEEYYEYKAGRIPVGARDTYLRKRIDASGSGGVESGGGDTLNRDALTTFTDGDDDDDADADDDDEGDSSGENGTAHAVDQEGGQIHQRRRIVRRGSEGYLVRDAVSTAYPAHRKKRVSFDGDNEEVGSLSETDDDDDDAPLVNLRSKQK